MDTPTLEYVVKQTGAALNRLEDFQARYNDHASEIEEARKIIADIIGFAFADTPTLVRPLPNMPQACLKCGGRLEITNRIISVPLLHCSCGWTWETWIKVRSWTP